MADTSTPKLALPQFDPLLNYDVNKFSAAFLKIDNAFGTVICTSTTRPSTDLFDGLTLWETDTRRLVIRSSGAWVVIPTRVIIADATARGAITTPYDGMQIWRQDMDWTETYDGTAWRVPNGVTTAALANITNPFTNQIALLSTDQYYYRYNGSSWVAFQHVSNTNTAEYTRTTSQTVTTNTVQRVDLPTTVKSSVDLSKATVSGGSEFTVLRAGRWLISYVGAWQGNTAGTLRAWWIERTPSGSRVGINAQTPGTGGLVFFHAFNGAKEVDFAVNDKFSICCYHDRGSDLGTETGQSTIGMTARWMGPS